MDRKKGNNNKQQDKEIFSLDEQNKDQISEQDNVDNYYKEWEDDRT